MRWIRFAPARWQKWRVFIEKSRWRPRQALASDRMAPRKSTYDLVGARSVNQIVTAQWPNGIAVAGGLPTPMEMMQCVVWPFSRPAW
jgi:hypothetical protein